MSFIYSTCYIWSDGDHWGYTILPEIAHIQSQTLGDHTHKQCSRSFIWILLGQKQHKPTRILEWQYSNGMQNMAIMSNPTRKLSLSRTSASRHESIQCLKLSPLTQTQKICITCPTKFSNYFSQFYPHFAQGSTMAIKEADSYFFLWIQVFF